MRKDTPRRKVVIDHDPEPDLSWLEQWDTAEKYCGNEIIACPVHPYATVNGRKRAQCNLCHKLAQPMPFETYRKTVGDPENHVTLCLLTYELGPDDEDWRIVDSLGNIDFFTDGDGWKTGTFYRLSELDGCPYLRELAKDAGLR